MNSASASTSSGDGASNKVSSDDLIKRSTSWTLGCDALLLNKLESLSKELEQTSSGILEECSALSKDVTLVQAKLGNVTNQFLMLSNSQFVENRVQEFQEASSSSDLQLQDSSKMIMKEKTKAEKEADLIAKMKEAIRLGICATDQHINSLPDSPATLPLPYLIGSPKYFSNRYVGLIDEFRLAEERRLGLVPERSESESPSWSTTQPETDNPAVVSNSNRILPSPSSHPVQQDSIFNIPTATHSQNQPISTATSQPENTVPYDNHNHISKLGKQDQNKQPVILPPTTSANQKQEDKYFRKSFEPPPNPAADSSDESDDDFKPIVSGSGGFGAGRLFVDDDDDDLFNDSSLFPSKTNTNNLFFNDNLTNSTKPKPASPPPTSTSTSISRNKNQHQQDIFANPSASASAHVGNLPINPNVNHKHSQHPQEGHSISQAPSATASYETSATKKLKIPPHAVPIFGNVPHTEIPRLKTPTQENIQPQPQPRSVAVEPEVKTGNESITRSSNANKRSNSNSTNASTNENEDHDTASQSSRTSISKGLTSSQGSLGDPVNPTTRSKKPKDIFDDESDDDFLFNPSGPKKLASVSVSSSLFKDNLISTSSSKNTLPNLPLPSQGNKNLKSKVKTRVKSSIFDDSDSDDDLFSSASSTSSKNKPFQPVVFPSTNSNASLKSLSNRGLFDDDSDESGDLFSQVQPQPGNKNKLSRTNVNDHDQDDHVDVTDHLNNGKNYSNQPRPEIRNIDSVPGAKAKKQGQASGNMDENESLSLGDKDNYKQSKLHLNDEAFSDMNKPSPVFQTVDTDTDIAPSSKPNLTKPKKEMEVAVPTVHRAEPEPQAGKDKDTKVSISKIKERLAAEKAKELEKSDIKKSLENKKDSKINVKKLALDLKINPLAMRPGARPKKQSSSEENENADSPNSESCDILPKSPHAGSPTKENESESTSTVTPLDTQGEPKADGHDTSSGQDQEHEPSKPNVKKLALGLNINPFAMRPDAKRKRQKSVDTPESETEKDSPKTESKLLPEIDSNLSIPDPVPLEGDIDINQSKAVGENAEAESLASKPSVKKLAMGLNINPLSMRPDSKPNRQKCLDKSETPTPTSESRSFSENLEKQGTPTATPQMSKESSVDVDDDQGQGDALASRRESKESTPGCEGDPDTAPRRLLSSLVKTRVKMMAKRKPPSKKLLHSFSERQPSKEDDVDSSSIEIESPETENVDPDHLKENVDNSLSREPTEPEPSKKLELKCDDVDANTDQSEKSTTTNTNSASMDENLDQPKVSEVEKSSKSSLSPPPEGKERREDSLFSEQEDMTKPSTSGVVTPPLPVQEPPPIPSLWEDSDSDSDDIFASAVISKSKSKTEKFSQDPIPVPAADLFGESESKEDKLSVSVFKDLEKRLPNQIASIADEFSENHEKNEIFPEVVENAPEVGSRSEKEKDHSNPDHVLPSQQPSEAPTNANPKSTSNTLFFDGDPESDEDIFASKSNALLKPKPTKKSEPSKSKPPVRGEEQSQSQQSSNKSKKSTGKKKAGQKSGLFDSDSDGSDDLFKTATASAKKSSLVPNTVNAPLEKEIENSKTKRVEGKKASVANKSLFSDSSDDDLFSSKRK